MKTRTTILISILAMIVAAGATYGVFSFLDIGTVSSSNLDTERTVVSSQEASPSPQTQQPTVGIDDSSVASIEDSQDVRVKQVLVMIAADLVSYATNNRGSLPATEAQLAAFSTSYLRLDDVHPVTKVPYQLVMVSGVDTDILYQPGFTCDESEAVAGEPRQFALITTLPSGTAHCVSM